MTAKTSRPSFRSRLPFDAQTLRLLIISIALFALFSIALPGTFLSVRNLQSMAVQLPEFGILALGIMLTMLTGGIDLSIVGAANLSAIVAALILTRLTGGAGEPLTMAIPLSILAALITGGLCGLLNGFLVSVVGIVPILATLGTGSLYTGLSFVITRGPAITTTQLSFIGNGSIIGLPIPMIVFIVMVLFGAVMLTRSALGFNIYMLGTNATAARFSGINSFRVLMRTYLMAGLAAGIAGVVFLARTNSAKPDYGSSFILLSVLIAILGGVSTTGGFGSIWGMILAVFSIQFLSTGLNFLMLDLFPSSAAIFFRQFAWGALLLLVMVLNYYDEKRRNRQPKTPRNEVATRKTDTQ